MKNESQLSEHTKTVGKHKNSRYLYINKSWVKKKKKNTPLRKIQTLLHHSHVSQERLRSTGHLLYLNSGRKYCHRWGGCEEEFRSHLYISFWSSVFLFISWSSRVSTAFFCSVIFLAFFFSISIWNTDNSRDSNHGILSGGMLVKSSYITSARTWMHH